MPSQHLGACLECGKSVFGPPGTTFGGFAAWQVNCSCIREHLTPFMKSSAYAFMLNPHDEGAPYDLTCKRVKVLGTEVLVFSMSKGSETSIVGHIGI